MKIKNKLLITTSIISVIPISTIVVSCSNSKNNDQDNSGETKPPTSPTNELEKLYNEGIISVSFGNISQNYFDKFKNNLNEIEKLILFTNNSDYQIKVSFTKPPTYDQTKKVLVCEFKFENLSNNETFIVSKEISYNFVTQQDYEKEAINFICQNLVIKPELQNKKILNAFKQTSSNKEFIDKFIDSSQALLKVVGITFEISIPTQTCKIGNENFIRTIATFYDENGEKINTTGMGISSPEIKIDIENQDTFTIFNYEDLEKSQISNFNESYLGELLFRSQNGETLTEISINFNFSNKGIINEVDFSPFNHITFNSSFASNYITSIKFNSNATIESLNSRLFSSNRISSVVLPKLVKKYYSDCFDSNVIVKGIDAIESIKSFYNSSTKDLDLRNVTDSSELETILKIVSNVLERNKLVLNKVYLPNHSKLSSSVNCQIECNELILYDDQNQYYDWVSYNMNQWRAKKIIVPSSIIKFDETKFNSSSTIERTLNSGISSLIQNNKLTLNKNSKATINNKTYNLWTDINNLDLYFFGANLSINSIIFDEETIDISSISTSKWKFFIQSLTLSKQIIIKSSVKKMTNISFINNLRKSNVDVVRENPFNSNILQNGIFNLNAFYSQFIDQTKNDFNQYLFGCEEYITSFDTTGINAIKQYTFRDLDDSWANISIELSSNINSIEQYAFYNSKIKINLVSFNPTTIDQWAFYGSTISGNLELTNLTSLNNNSFYSTNIESISLPNITTIPNRAFYNCKKLVSVNIPSVSTIGEYSFYGCSLLENIDLSNVTKINSNAFYGCTNLSISIDLSSVTVESKAFYNCKNLISITNFDWSSKYIDDEYGTDVNLISKILPQLSRDEIIKEINFDEANKILDLSNLDINDIKIYNCLFLFFKQFYVGKQTINELIIPETYQISDRFSKIFNSNITIEKLTWNYNMASKTFVNKTLKSQFGNAIIKTINEDFFLGLSSITTTNVLDQYNQQSQRINLNGISKIGNSVFGNLNQKPIEFINTQDVKEIGANSFYSNCSFEISTDVKLQINSFTTVGIINNSNITRKTIFSSSFKFYDAKTKTLDFSNATSDDLNRFKSNQKLMLIDGDVNNLILPSINIISSGIFDNLGNIQSITFQNRNQIILENAFSGTNILNKPQQSSTHILLDLDSFFA